MDRIRDRMLAALEDAISNMDPAEILELLTDRQRMSLCRQYVLGLAESIEAKTLDHDAAIVAMHGLLAVAKEETRVLHDELNVTRSLIHRLATTYLSRGWLGSEQMSELLTLDNEHPVV